jgi:hypothetical protein
MCVGALFFASVIISYLHAFNTIIGVTDSFTSRLRRSTARLAGFAGTVERDVVQDVEHLEKIVECGEACDNIAGISFASTLCLKSVDIVYTWVNGSDPRLVRGLSLPSHPTVPIA